jgi:hypothetical protein
MSAEVSQYPAVITLVPAGAPLDVEGVAFALPEQLTRYAVSTVFGLVPSTVSLTAPMFQLETVDHHTTRAVDAATGRMVLPRRWLESSFARRDMQRRRFRVEVSGEAIPIAPPSSSSSTAAAGSGGGDDDAAASAARAAAAAAALRKHQLADARNRLLKKMQAELAELDANWRRCEAAGATAGGGGSQDAAAAAAAENLRATLLPPNPFAGIAVVDDAAAIANAAAASVARRSPTTETSVAASTGGSSNGGGASGVLQAHTRAAASGLSIVTQRRMETGAPVHATSPADSAVPVGGGRAPLFGPGGVAAAAVSADAAVAAPAEYDRRMYRSNPREAINVTGGPVQPGGAGAPARTAAAAQPAVAPVAAAAAHTAMQRAGAAGPTAVHAAAPAQHAHTPTPSAPSTARATGASTTTTTTLPPQPPTSLGFGSHTGRKSPGAAPHSSQPAGSRPSAAQRPVPTRALDVSPPPPPVRTGAFGMGDRVETAAPADAKRTTTTATTPAAATTSATTAAAPGAAPPQRVDERVAREIRAREERERLERDLEFARQLQQRESDTAADAAMARRLPGIASAGRGAGAGGRGMVGGHAGGGGGGGGMRARPGESDEEFARRIAREMR